MEELFFTVFTPTYNRGYILNKLYNSLLAQTYQNFEWLIVDDGSIDNTQYVVNGFVEENKIRIKYIKTENKGKQAAINYATTVAGGRWFFIVDSDDYLVCNSLERIKYYLEQVQGNEKYAGVVGLRGNHNNEIIQGINSRKTFNTADDLFIDCSSIEYKYKYGMKGDRAEVIRTELLKKYKFPLVDGETFIPESYLWFSISHDGYIYRYFNEIVYITEYLPDGLTQNGKEVAKKNPNLRSIADNHMLIFKEIPLKERTKFCINYYRYGIYAGKTLGLLWKNCNDKLLSTISIIIAIMYKVK